MIRSSPGGIGIKGLADRTGVHENTVRFHLDRLVDDGQVERRAAPSGGPGRPPLRFVARPETGRENYELIARVLAGHLESQREDPGEFARQAGRAWGRSWARPGIPDPGWEPALEGLTQTLDGAGFSPEIVGERDAEQVAVRVHHCPFLTLARQDQVVPCGIHLGLMEGALEAAGEDATVTLHPFDTDTTCLAVLTRSAS